MLSHKLGGDSYYRNLLRYNFFKSFIKKEETWTDPQFEPRLIIEILFRAIPIVTKEVTKMIELYEDKTIF